MSRHDPFKTGPAGLAATRRGLLGLMAGGAAGVAVAGSARAQERVTVDALQCAEPVLGVSYTPAEREMMIQGMDAWVARAERLRALEQPNELSPALVFDPRLPGRTYREQTGGVTNIPREAGPLPSDAADIAFAPVWKQAAWMTSGALTSAELTEIYLARIEQHGPALECFVTVTADLARRQAAAMDRERAAGRVRGPLHGVPYGLKDIIDVAGYPSTWGAEVYRDRVAENTATVAWRLEQAGAVLLGKTTSGAIAYGDIWYDGITRNPFNPNEGSSGSSAGSASATAAGLVGFAIGTETLGSIVSPSNRCGSTGLRPTFGRVPKTGAMALCWSLDKIGPLVRSAPDAALVLAAINGADDKDPSAVTHGFEADLSRDVRGMRVGYDPAWFEDGEEPDRAALAVARGLGVELVEIEIEDKPYDTLLTTLEAEAAAAFEELTLQNLDDSLRWQEPAAWPNTWRRARFASAVDLVNVDRFRREVMVQMEAKFEGLDAIIGPNFAGAMLLITNYTGHPQLAFRSGFVERPTRTIFGAATDESGDTFTVPMSTSLWAPLFEEGNIIALGRAIEEVLGVAERRPPQFS